MSDHLIDHKYTVLEIERMRKATYELMFPWVWHSHNASSRVGSGGRAGEAEEKAEVQLRTYLLAGVRPEELEAIQIGREEQYRLNRPPLLQTG